MTRLKVPGRSQLRDGEFPAGAAWRRPPRVRREFQSPPYARRCAARRGSVVRVCGLVSPAWPAAPAPASPLGRWPAMIPHGGGGELGPADVDDLPAGRPAPGQPRIHPDDLPDQSLRAVLAGPLGEPHPNGGGEMTLERGGRSPTQRLSRRAASPASFNINALSNRMCRLTAVRCPSRRTRSQDRDGATTRGTFRAPTG